jgi:hypothetical protein
MLLCLSLDVVKKMLAVKADGTYKEAKVFKDEVCFSGEAIAWLNVHMSFKLKETWHEENHA